MRLLSFTHHDDNLPLLGVRCGARILDIAAAARIAEVPDMPTRMKKLLAAGPNAMARVRDLSTAAQAHDGGTSTRRGATRPGSACCRRWPTPTSSSASTRTTAPLSTRSPERAAMCAEQPTAFVKLDASLVGHRAHVVRPEGVVRLDCEPALVFVIGKRGVAIRKAEAFRHVAGVTLLADLADRDALERELRSGSRFLAGKNVPGFGPLGPELVTLDEIADPYDLWLTCAVNGAERLRVNTREQIWRLPDIVEHVSRYLPLEPGDMLATGAPRGIAEGAEGTASYLEPGDVVDCAIEGFTTLRTTIVAPTAKQRLSRRRRDLRAEPRRGSRRSASFRDRGDLVGAELDHVAGRRGRLDPKQVALHGRADVHLQLAIADRAADARVRLELEPMLDVEVAGDGAVDDRVAAADAALDHAARREHQQRRRLGVAFPAGDVALDAAVDAHAAGEDHVAGDLDALGDQRRELRHLDERLLLQLENMVGSFALASALAGLADKRQLLLRLGELLVEGVDLALELGAARLRELHRHPRLGQLAAQRRQLRRRRGRPGDDDRGCALVRQIADRRAERQRDDDDHRRQQPAAAPALPGERDADLGQVARRRSGEPERHRQRSAHSPAR